MWKARREGDMRHPAVKSETKEPPAECTVTLKLSEGQAHDARKMQR
jgi:hypothetical protein